MGWERIKAVFRDDLDTSIAIISGIAGLVLAATSLFGLTDIKILLAITQVALASLSVSILRDRLSERARNASLGEVTRAVHDMSLIVRGVSEPMVFENQDAPYAQIMEYISRYGVREAVFLQYSGQACATVVEAVLRTPGAKVTMYLQDEKTAAALRSEFQAQRISGSIHNLSFWHLKYGATSELNVYKCSMPMSVRAILLDDRLLCMGWYTYERDQVSDVRFPDDTVAVFGHDTAVVVARKGTPEFEALHKTFKRLASNYEHAREVVTL